MLHHGPKGEVLAVQGDVQPLAAPGHHQKRLREPCTLQGHLGRGEGRGGEGREGEGRGGEGRGGEGRGGEERRGEERRGEERGGDSDK